MTKRGKGDNQQLGMAQDEKELPKKSCLQMYNYYGSYPRPKKKKKEKTMGLILLIYHEKSIINFSLIHMA